MNDRHSYILNLRRCKNYLNYTVITATVIHFFILLSTVQIYEFHVFHFHFNTSSDIWQQVSSIVFIDPVLYQKRHFPLTKNSTGWHTECCMHAENVSCQFHFRFV